MGAGDRPLPEIAGFTRAIDGAGVAPRSGMATDELIKLDPITEVRLRIEKSLHLRSAPTGTLLARVEQFAKEKGAVLWHELRKRPSIGVLLVAGAGIALASAVGVGELTIGVAAGYAAYLVLRQGMAPRAAVEEVIAKLEGAR